MMKALGYVLLVLGIGASLITGMMAANDTQSYRVMGVRIGVQYEDWSPFTICVSIAVVGFVMLVFFQRSKTLT